MLITKTDLELYYSADIIKQWADDDRDGVADEAVLSAAILDVTGHVENVLKPHYPAYVPFAAAALPAEIKSILLKQIGYQLAGRRQKAAEHYAALNDQAEQRLQALTQRYACLLFPDGATVASEGSRPVASGGAGNTTGTPEIFTEERFKGYV